MIGIMHASESLNRSVETVFTRPFVYEYDNPRNVWDEDCPELETLRKHLELCVQSYAGRPVKSVDGWCVTLPTSNTHLQKHNHAEHADVIAVYYAANDNPVGEGDIEVYNDADELVLTYHPEPATMLIFPGSWNHRVTPYTGRRLSIAMNIRL